MKLSATCILFLEKKKTFPESKKRVAQLGMEQFTLTLSSILPITIQDYVYMGTEKSQSKSIEGKNAIQFVYIIIGNELSPLIHLHFCVHSPIILVIIM